MKRFFSNTKGTVMMECILTLPLHLLALFGTVYLGTLAGDCYAVVSMDHFTAFVSRTAVSGVMGTMGEVDSKVKNFFFPEDSDITFKNMIPEAKVSSDKYAYLAESRINGTRSLPRWLEGIRVVSTLLLQIDEEKNEPLKKKTVASSNDAKGGSAAIIANPAYAIDRSTQWQNKWAVVANEPFVFGPKPAPVAAESLNQYDRNSDCVTWSVSKP
jgi:hypothetical protein